MVITWNSHENFNNFRLVCYIAHAHFMVLFKKVFRDIHPLQLIYSTCQSQKAYLPDM
jgi:hypothetical protein